MRHPVAGQVNPKLRELVAEASCALARLDTARLEELALSCEALNRGLEEMSADEKGSLAQQAREAAAGMAVFARVLEATRSNLRVMSRLRELRTARLEYSERQVGGGAKSGPPSTDLGRWGEKSGPPSTDLGRSGVGAEDDHGID